MISSKLEIQNNPYETNYPDHMSIDRKNSNIQGEPLINSVSTLLKTGKRFQGVCLDRVNENQSRNERGLPL